MTVPKFRGSIIGGRAKKLEERPVKVRSDGNVDDRIEWEVAPRGPTGRSRLVDQ